MSSELEWIERIRRRAGLPRAGGVVVGIGDDCAIFRPRGAGEDLLFTTDMLIEDVHFHKNTHRATDVGWKALARGLSDIAAMGGTPRFFLVSLAVARWAGTRWVDGFYRGALRLARRAGLPLAGGDVACSSAAMWWCAARYRAAPPCAAAGRARATRSTYRAVWVALRSVCGWAGGLPGSAICVRSRAWHWGVSCANASVPARRWI